MQAKYKMGRCHEKLGKLDAAIEYYMDVVYAYLSERDKGQTPPGALWFTRAAFGAATIKESERQWKQAVNIYRKGYRSWRSGLSRCPKKNSEDKV